MEDPTFARNPGTTASTDAGTGNPASLARDRLSWLRARHPRTLVWYGNATGRWWALAGGRLVEALDPVELDRAITTPLVWPWPRVAGR